MKKNTSCSKKIIDDIEYPKDLKKKKKDDLKQISEEVRQYLIKTIKKTGGHFASNLGVVELSVALHYVFDTPKDKIIWDVGHQAYAHKVLTGRKKKLNTIRKKNGIRPFPSREESEYDAFGVGHSSTSIGAGIGMALAQDDNKNSSRIVSIIGDGALTAGMAFEALNHGGEKKVNMLVILNDNEMSISPNVGGLSKYLTRLISFPGYTAIRERGKKILSNAPNVKKFVKKTELHAKGSILPCTLFEELGWNYFGPIDAHDIDTLVEVLTNLKDVKGPKFLHVISKKGKGCAQAMNNCTQMHAISPKSKEINKIKKQKYTDIFSDWICEKAKNDKDVHAITPAMCTGSGLVKFEKEYKKRYHDVGIAEQHAVTLSAGLACEGKKPVVAIYSTFLQRAYDQLLHDVALQNLDVLFAVDRAGVVGPDGATHSGSFDISFLRIIPNVIILVPSSGEECKKMLDFGYNYPGTVVVRYPRGEIHKDFGKGNEIVLGKANVVRKGKKIAILAFGHFVSVCDEFSKEKEITLVDMRFVKPIDVELMKELSKIHDIFVTIEDNVKAGGAGSLVNEVVLNNDLDVKVLNLGLPDRFQEHASREELLQDAELDIESIKKVITKFL